MNSPDSSRDISIKREEPEDHSHLDILHMVVCKEEVSSKQERSHRLLQEELEPPHIKEEEEELLKRPEEPAGSMLTLLPVKIEDGDEDISSRSSEVEVEVELESESDSEVGVESDFELTEDSDDWDETNGGQSADSASNTSSITRKNQGVAEEPRSYSHLNCAHSIKKNILLINTPWQMQDTSAKKPRPIMPRPSLIRSSECQQVTTFKQQQLQTQAKAQHTIDVPIVSQHQSSREVCKGCHKRFLHLNKHLSQSPPCQSYYDIHYLESKHNEPILQLCNQCHNSFRHLNMHLSKSPPCKTYYNKHAIYRQRQLQTQAHHTIDTTIVSQHEEVCKQCHTHFRHLNMHLSKSPPCRTYYDIHSLQKKVDKHANYRQRQRQLKTQAKAHHTIDIQIAAPSSRPVLNRPEN